MLATAMTCPKCGFPSQSDQKFCRACGASLRVTTQPLMELKPERGSASGARIQTQPGNALVLWGFVIMLIGVAVGVVGKKLLHEDIVTVVGVLISLVGMFLTVYPYLSPARRQRIESTPSSTKPEVVIASPPANYLPQGSDTEYVSSVTERTTDLLKISVSAPSQKGSRDSSAADKLERTEES